MGGFINGVCGFWFLFWGLGLAWVSGYEFSRQISKEDMSQFPHLGKWIARIAEVSLFLLVFWK